MSRPIHARKPVQAGGAQQLVDLLSRIESFTPDKQCKCCGAWRSEHDYQVCRAPVWVDPTDD